MKAKVTFSQKRVLLIFGAVGLLLGVLLVGAILYAGPVRAQNGGITADEAKAIVEKAYPNATVVEVERDDSGRDAYEAELDSGVDVLVDATTGEIIANGIEAGDTGGDDGKDGDNVQEESQGQ